MSSLSNQTAASRNRIAKRKQNENKKLENRIMGYIETLSAKDPVTPFDVNASLRAKFYDYGRTGESKLRKEIEKAMESIVKKHNPEQKSTRKFYTKADFYLQADEQEQEDQKPVRTFGNGNVEVFDTEKGLMMKIK